MKNKRIFICIGAALLFMCALFRPGCRIILNGTAMPGIYEINAVSRCAAKAARSADEITRSAEDAPFTIVPVLCLQRQQPDEELLYHVLLESYAGVEKLYAVSAGTRQIGLTDNLLDIYRLRREYPAVNIQFTELYTYAGAETDFSRMQEALAILEGTLSGPF